MMAAGVTQNQYRSLGSLLEGLVTAADRSAWNVNYRRFCADSREVQAGDVFLAISGSQRDGTDFIGTALERGAVAVIHESQVNDVIKEAANRRHIPLIHDPALKEHTGLYAGRFHEDPSSRLKVVAVTGTDGKTSVSHFAAQAIDILGGRSQSCGIIGTAGNGFYKN
jgi:UDP-N-acetylmuramoyl-L-alanyl-D-glutamate--2,6-diaminopimelate ligase